MAAEALEEDLEASFEGVACPEGVAWRTPEGVGPGGRWKGHIAVVEEHWGTLPVETKHS